MPAPGRVQPGPDRRRRQRRVEPAPEHPQGPPRRLRRPHGQEHHDEALHPTPLREDRQQCLPQPHPFTRRMLLLFFSFFLFFLKILLLLYLWLYFCLFPLGLLGLVGECWLDLHQG